MKTFLTLCLGVHGLLLAKLSDSKCTSAGGTCLDKADETCTTGNVQSGKCHGPSHRRCCIGAPIGASSASCENALGPYVASSGYLRGLDCDKQHNVQLVLNACKKLGITNPYTQAAILAIASKESGFKMRAEGSYKNTSNERIRKIFRFARELSDAELNRLKQSAEEFFSKAYGGRYGNAAWPSRDGYNYRGRGFNQITFKGNYERAAEATGQPLVEQPELLDQPQYAAEALAGYFTRRFKSFQQKHVAAYGVRCTAGRSTNGHNECLNGFTSLENAVLGVYHANAGLGKAIFTANSADSTDGMRRALERKEEFLGYVKANCNGDFSALKCE